MHYCGRASKVAEIRLTWGALPQVVVVVLWVSEFSWLGRRKGFKC